MEPELILHVDDEQVLRCRTCESSLPSHGVCECNKDRVRVLPLRWLNQVSSSSSPSSCCSSDGGTDSKERPRRFLPRIPICRFDSAIVLSHTKDCHHRNRPPVGMEGCSYHRGLDLSQLQLCHAVTTVAALFLSVGFGRLGVLLLSSFFLFPLMRTEKYKKIARTGVSKML